MTAPQTATPDAPTVSIIVVSFNTKQMTLDCLRSVYEQTRTPFELIVIDNASADGSADAIAEAFPDVALLRETDNHGFAKANNIASEWATGEFILLLNPDTVVLDNAIDKLVDFARAKPDAKIWGGRTLYGDMSLNRTCCFQRMSLRTVIGRFTGLTYIFKNHRLLSEAYGGWAMDTVRPVDIVTGCFLLIPRPLWNALGGFNLTYFMYGEEADLCIRAKRDYGADPHYTPDAVIIHYGGASEHVPVNKTVKLFAAKMTLLRHHMAGWKRPLALQLFRLISLQRLWILRILSWLLPSDRVRKAAAYWSEIWARRDEWQAGLPDVEPRGITPRAEAAPEATATQRAAGT